MNAQRVMNYTAVHTKQLDTQSGPKGDTRPVRLLVCCLNSMLAGGGST